jgi:hypothetical protein
MSADVDSIAGSRARAKNGLPSWHRANHYDVGQNAVQRLGDVPSSERYMKLAGEGEQATKEVLDPGLWKICWQTKREKCGERLAAHSRDITEPSRQAAMADGDGWMPSSSKVHIFEAEVCCDQDLVARLDTQNSAVITDACD